MSFYITTPLYYVNSDPHLGHAYTTVLADVIRRYHRLHGEETFFLTGVDEHGQKVLDAARKLGQDPQEHCDEMAVRFEQLWRDLDVEYDHFFRTTSPEHVRVVQEVLQRLWDEGEIYLDDYEGWYCVSDERYFTEKDLVENRCPLCGKEVERFAERNYFFRMGKHRDWLRTYIEEHPDFILPATRRNEVLGFLKNELGDLCISRSRKRMAWGIPLPFDDDFVTYVWFDALLNYVTGPGYINDPERFARWWPADIHLIGKDILTTHAVYWPTMLHAAGLPLPRHLVAHGWWLVENAKMAKSVGNVVNPLDLIRKVGVDAFRFFLIRGIVPWNDAGFSEELLTKTVNTYLANDLGNLLSRITNLISKFFAGKLPAAGALHPDFVKGVEQINGAFRENLETANIYRIVDDVLELVRRANRYMEQAAPWKLAKSDPEAAGKVLYNALEVVRIAAGYLLPVMPRKSREILARLGIDALDDFQSFFRLGLLQPGTPIKHGTPVFPRLENPTKAPVVNKKEQKAPSVSREDSPPGIITFADFGKVQLRTARVLSAGPVAGADRLLLLQVDLGTEQRQIVAGVAEYYRPEDLTGRNIVVVANLKPARIRGQLSQGMLLAAKKGDRLAVVMVPDEFPPGAEVS